METTTDKPKSEAPHGEAVRNYQVRLAPPFAFEAVEGAVGVLLNSKDCVNGGHHCALTIEAAELAHEKLGEAIALAKSQKAAK